MTGTVLGDLMGAVEHNAESVAVRMARPGEETVELTWRELASEAAKVAGALKQIGVERGSRVGMLLRNRPEFHVADLACLLAGATPISLYPSSPAAQLAPLLGHSRVRAVVVDDSELLERLLSVRDGLPDLRAVVIVDDRDGIAPAEVIRFRALTEAAPLDIAAAVAAVAPEDAVTVIYTSGTTEMPKGVVLSHSNVVSAAESLRRGLGVSASDLNGSRVVSYLPMAHVAERLVSHYLAVRFAFEVTACPDLGLLGRSLVEVRPDIVFGVPQVWERIRARVAGVVPRDAPGLVGLDRATYAFTGSAPAPADLIHWYRGIGVPLRDLYGLSETTGPLTVDGRTLPGVDLRLDTDGEILVRGATVFTGYLDDAGATASAFDGHGWFRTGDIGTVDGDGALRVIDRKKDLIVTSGGKNVSPAGIEATLRSVPPIVQAAVVGDGRPYLVALLTAPDGTASASIADAVDEANRRVSPPERIKKWVVVAMWDEASGVVTPTMKIKRGALVRRYAAEIEALY